MLVWEFSAPPFSFTEQPSRIMKAEASFTMETMLSIVAILIFSKGSIFPGQYQSPSGYDAGAGSEDIGLLSECPQHNFFHRHVRVAHYAIAVPEPVGRAEVAVVVELFFCQIERNNAVEGHRKEPGVVGGMLWPSDISVRSQRSFI